ncbi:hypothetical protein [Pontiella sulfatireligans]|uniref:Uncharacterized protein n=1 Tax=Pontiella sulfatireligans TaxID=2750658 RepID=A0A6C2USZ3_9BACT|nr:hypothetical protein [Pontiella sulfatireligans]VGO23435.1 hypothetical protein SCARR_05542 [Pontiella sulfatireligans]
MKKALAVIKKELLELLPPFLYFLVLFYVIIIIRSLMVNQYGIPAKSSVAALIGALIVGKSILIADLLPISNWFKKNRLVYNVIWRSLLYASIVLVFQILEEWIPLIKKSGGAWEAFKHLGGEIHWHRFVATHLITVLFLIVYNATSTLVGALGREKVVSIFFGKRSTDG